MGVSIVIGDARDWMHKNIETFLVEVDDEERLDMDAMIFEYLADEICCPEDHEDAEDIRRQIADVAEMVAYEFKCVPLGC